VAGGDERDELVAQVDVRQRVPVFVAREDVAALGECWIGADAGDVRAE
jgi:hypothetical protein